MNSSDKAPNEYLLIQRCKTYHEWPKYSTTRGFLLQPRWEPRSIRVNDTTCEIKTRYEVRTASEKAGPEHVNLYSDVWEGGGFLLGRNRLVTSGGGTQDVHLRKHDLEPGMVEFALRLRSAVELKEENFDQFSHELSGLIGYLAIYFDDIILPVTRIHLVEVDGEGKNVHYTHNWHLEYTIKNVKQIGIYHIQTAMNNYAPFGKLRYEDLREFATAYKRYSSSMSEDDVVDQFCDLWEACEFLAKKAGRGKIDSKIANALAKQLGVSETSLKTEYVSKYYRMRKDLVHNAIENETKLREEVRVLEQFVFELLGYRAGIGFKRDRSAEILKVLERLSHGK